MFFCGRGFDRETSYYVDDDDDVCDVSAESRLLPETFN